MMEFFKPWRRKVGGVTLVLALVTMGGWMRSLIGGDYVQLQIGRYRGFYLSYCGRLDLWIKYHEDDSDAVQTGYWRSGMGDLEAYFASHSFFHEWNNYGISIIGPVRLPYWSIVLPLSLLSAHLLLKKPDSSTRTKISESTANEGA